MTDGNAAGGGLERFEQTSIAFDELIVQVGRAIARAQREMDLSQVDFQRKVVLALKEGRMRRLEVPPPHAYTLPETKLSLKIGLSMRYPEGGGAPTLSAVPLNATTTNQGDVDVEASTEVNLRFVAVPPSTEPRGPAPSALSAEDVRRILLASSAASAAIEALGPDAAPWLDYADEARLWTVTLLVAREPVLVALVDDRRGALVGVLAAPAPPSADALALVGAPIFHRVEPGAACQGELLTVHGDNLLTLAGQTVLRVDGRPVPPLRVSMRALTFKLPGWVTRGDVEVETPLGSTREAGRAAFSPIPRLDGFEPRRGTYDTVRRRGTSISILGSNLRPGLRIRFSSGALTQEATLLSPGRAQVEVPPGAGSGPLTLVFGERTQTLPAPSFTMLPRVDRITPRQARVGAEVAVLGSSLEQVSELSLGEGSVAAKDFVLHTPEQIRFRVPPDASDGPIVLRQGVGAESIEARGRELFFVVPRIVGFSARVVTPGELLTVRGDGLDADPAMMMLLFEGRGGPSEAPVLSVSSDRRSLITRVPVDAVTGFVLLLRKRVYSEASPADTSNTSLNKLTVLTAQGAPSDVLIEERFEGDLAAWTEEAGAWRIDDGTLASSGTSRLGFTLPAPREALAIYADVLRAGRFGFSLTPSGGGPRLQVWVDLLGDEPALTWSTVDERGRQELLGGMALALFAGQDHLAQVVISRELSSERVALKIAFLLDQKLVQERIWEVPAVRGAALLADAGEQRWDNVVVLKGQVLSIPEPELYRFGAVPEPPAPPLLRVDSFEPGKGPPGTAVTLSGVGLDDAARFFFGGMEAAVVRAVGAQAVVTVPAGGRTGPIEVRGRGGAIITTGERWFWLPPQITELVPNPALAGMQLHLAGTNLPVMLDEARVSVHGTIAQVVSAAPTLLIVLVPDVAGAGVVEVRSAGFVAQAPVPLVVRREEVLQDLVEAAPQAVWSTSAGEVPFGTPPEGAEASAQLRRRERLEDGLEYGPVLFVHPPSPAQRALRGIFPTIEVPQTGGIEMRVSFGLLYGAARQPDDPAEVDGVLFEIGFRPVGGGAEIPLVPRSACVHDASLEQYAVDATAIGGKVGQLVFSIFPGRSGLRDEAALVSARLVQVT